ncbi:hypothetical protein EV1_038382 [Malus domestica]
MVKSSFAPIFFPAKRLSPPKPPPHTIFTCFAHTAPTVRQNASTKPPRHYSPASHFRLHLPPFLPKALSLLRLHNRRPRRCFHPNRRRPANDKLRPVTLKLAVTARVDIIAHTI